MPGKSSVETRVSLGVSALATVVLARATGVHLNAQNWGKWLFASGLMLLCGWGLFYNLWLLATHRGAQALCLGEPDAPTWTPLSANVTTILLGLFWVRAMLLVGAIRA